MTDNDRGTMTDDDLRAFLREFYDDTTPEQRATLLQTSDRIYARWPDPDLEDTRREAFTGALAVILGDDTLEAVAVAWQRARAVERDAHAALTGALIASEGSEVDLARRAGVTRMTVRKALGK